jgi:hypothetical protein
MSDISMSLARHWLTSCEERHSCMGNFDRQYKAPPRLIYVGTFGAPVLRLEETERTGLSLRYAALSFVWGREIGGRGQTFQDNVERFKFSIDFTELPATLQDAVYVARALELQYLWVDSLCIIQNSPSDRQRILPLIGEIFSNATCVLAASSSSHVEEGFLQPRKRRDIVPIRGTETIIPTFLCEFIDYFDRDVESSILTSRGWVLQERVLARRTIYFTHTQMYWECGEGIRFETLAKLST